MQKFSEPITIRRPYQQFCRREFTKYACPGRKRLNRIIIAFIIF